MTVEQFSFLSDGAGEVGVVALVIAERQRLSLVGQCLGDVVLSSLVTSDRFLLVVLGWRVLEDCDLVEHDVENDDVDHTAQGSCRQLSDEKLKEVNAGGGGDEGVLRVTEDGGCAADIGGGGDAKADGEELATASALFLVLKEDERRYDQARGVVSDESRHKSREQTYSPKDVPQR